MSIFDRGSKTLKNKLSKLSVIIPSRNEAENLPQCLAEIYGTLNYYKINHEILVIDDGSSDKTKEIINELRSKFITIHYIQNKAENGFGRAVTLGLEKFSGDAVAIMMADRSDSPKNLITYWKCIQDGNDCVFGSRFSRGGKVYNYPLLKLLANRVVNKMIQFAFKIKCNDVTNAFKIYRREVIEGCRPFISPHFNLTVEIPLKAIVRGYSWKVVPISWKNRTKGVAKLKLREMGSRYFFIIAYVWLEKYFSRGDYLKK